MNENAIATYVRILEKGKDCSFPDESIEEIKKRLGGLSDKQLINSLLISVADFCNDYNRKIKENEELKKEHKNLQHTNSILQERCGMGNGRLQVEKAKQGVAIRSKLPFSFDNYFILHNSGLTQEQIAGRMNISLSTLRRRLKEGNDRCDFRLNI